MNIDVNERIKEIDIENYIWLIYIVIIILSYYSNYLERDYFINDNKKSKNDYVNINIIIFSILLAIYFYFLTSSLRNLKDYDKCTKEQQNKIILSVIASTLVLISGVIFLYLAYIDKDLDIELAFS